MPDADADPLVAQLTHHRRWLSRAVADVGADGARFELAPGRPSIAWILGHVTCGVDSIAEAVAGRGRGLEPAFLGRHGRAHWGVADAAGWEELRGEWERVSRRTAAALDALGPCDLDLAPAIEILPGFAEHLATRRAFLAGEVFHVAYHLGQIGTLRAALALGWD